MPLNFGFPSGDSSNSIGTTPIQTFDNPWSPAAGQDFGQNSEMNRILAEGVGYTGSFGGGEYGRWMQNNPGMKQASDAIRADYGRGNSGEQDFGRQQDINRQLSQTFGYGGDFGQGQWGAWAQSNLDPQQRDLAKQIVAGGGQNSLPNQTMGMWGQAGDLYGQIANQRPDTLAGTDLQPYMNPYTNQVVDRTMGEMNRQHDIQRNQMGDAAQAAGGFGGDRFGVMDAEMNRNHSDQQQNWMAQMMHNNFGQAQQGAQFDIGGQYQDINNMLNTAQGMGNLSNLGFGMGQGLQGMANQSGQQQMGFNQALLDQAQQQYGGAVGWPSQMSGLLSGSIPGYGGGQPYNQNMQLASGALQAFGPEFAKWAFS